MLFARRPWVSEFPPRTQPIFENDMMGKKAADLKKLPGSQSVALCTHCGSGCWTKGFVYVAFSWDSPWSLAAYSVPSHRNQPNMIPCGILQVQVLQHPAARAIRTMPSTQWQLDTVVVPLGNHRPQRDATCKESNIILSPRRGLQKANPSGHLKEGAAAVMSPPRGLQRTCTGENSKKPWA